MMFGKINIINEKIILLPNYNKKYIYILQLKNHYYKELLVFTIDICLNFGIGCWKRKKSPLNTYIYMNGFILHIVLLNTFKTIFRGYEMELKSSVAAAGPNLFTFFPFFSVSKGFFPFKKIYEYSYRYSASILYRIQLLKCKLFCDGVGM